MKNIICKMNQLEIFTEKLLKYAGWNNYQIQEPIIVNNGYRYVPDYLIEKGNVKYAVDVKYSLDLDTMKMNAFINRFNVLKEQGFENIVIVYNKVKQSKRDRLKEVAIVLDISNILYIIRKNTILTNELMGILDYSIENIEINKPCIDIEIEEVEELDNKNRIKILESISPGQNSFKIYQNFCIDTLKYLFLDTLDLWEIQNRTDNGLNIFDLICKIKNNISNEFFLVLENYFKSKYIVFEFKNYVSKISQMEVCTTEKYLYETALRKVSIIITRKGINTNGNTMIKGILRESGKLILVLDDEDIKI